MNLGAKVKDYRRSRGWTQEELAERARAFDRTGKLQQQNIQQLESKNGETSIYAPALADAFGISLDDLLRLDPSAAVKTAVARSSSISQLTLALAEILDNDHELRTLVLALVTRYEQDKKRGAEIAKAIKTLLGMT